jgi:hypothetical protein
MSNPRKPKPALARKTMTPSKARQPSLAHERSLARKAMSAPASGRAKKPRELVLDWGLGLEHEYRVTSGDGEIVDSRAALYEKSSSWHAIRNVHSVEAPMVTRVKEEDLKIAKEFLAEFGYLKSVNGHTGDGDVQAMGIKAFVQAMGIKAFASALQRGDEDLANGLVVSARNKLRVGDLITGDMYARTLYTVSVVNTAKKNNKEQLSGLQHWQTIGALVGKLRRHSIDETHTVPDTVPSHSIDGKFIESRSTVFKRQTAEAVLRQLRKSETTVLKIAAKNGIQSPSIFPWSGYVEDGTAEYAGSYHVWITLPHETARRTAAQMLQERTAFMQRHAHLAHLLQWIEPLVTTLFSGDPRALGRSDGKFSRASMRASLNPYSGYGTTPVDRMLDVPKSQKQWHSELIWFNSKEDLRTEQRSMKVRDHSWPLYIRVGGHKMPYSACLDIPREAGFSLDPLTKEPAIRLPDMPGKARAPGTGSDIRSMVCQSAAIPLHDGWKARWLRVKNTLELWFFNPEKNKLTADAPVDFDGWTTRDVRGIEFRAIDNMPQGNIDALVRLVVLLGDSAYKRGAKLATASYLGKNAAGRSVAWMEALDAVRLRGPHIQLPKAYLSALVKQLGLRPQLVNSLQNHTAFEMLVAIADAMHQEHMHGIVAQSMLADPSRPPKFQNTNQLAWEHAYASSKDQQMIKRSKDDKPFLRAMK